MSGPYFSGSENMYLSGMMLRAFSGPLRMHAQAQGCQLRGRVACSITPRPGSKDDASPDEQRVWAQEPR